MTKTMAAVLVASALWAPLTAHSAAAEDSAGGDITISVQIPARSGAPTASPSPTATSTPTVAPTATPTPTATTSAGPAAPGSDAGTPRPGALPATGGEIALWGAVLAVFALAAGLAIHARRRRRA